MTSLAKATPLSFIIIIIIIISVPRAGVFARPDGLELDDRQCADRQRLHACQILLCGSVRVSYVYLAFSRMTEALSSGNVAVDLATWPLVRR